jgi:UDP-glucose:(heptosyl)LPS alpha-1,3-glucosyltransferase
MEFAFFLFKYFPYGGLQRNCCRIAEACSARGHRVQLYTSDWQGPRFDWLPVTVFPKRAFTNVGREASMIRQARQVLARRAFDCVIGFCRMPGLDVYYAGDPCYAWRQKDRPFLHKWFARRFRYRIAWERGIFGADSTTDIQIGRAHV